MPSGAISSYHIETGDIETLILSKPGFLEKKYLDVVVAYKFFQEMFLLSDAAAVPLENVEGNIGPGIMHHYYESYGPMT
jgi:hypothetical protein